MINDDTKNKEKLKKDFDKMIKRHGNTLRKYIEKYGKEEFIRSFENKGIKDKKDK